MRKNFLNKDIFKIQYLYIKETMGKDMKLLKFITTTIREHLNENIVVKNVLYSDIQKFIKSNNLESLINSCDLSKGNCDTVTKKLYNYLLSVGYNDADLQEIELLNPKFETDGAHSEWQKYDKKYLVHVILKVGDFFVDLTGSQYSKSQSGIKIYTLSELGSLWGNYKIMKKDSEDKYIGGDYSKAKVRKF